MTVAIIVAYDSAAHIDACVRAGLASGVSQIVVWDNSPTGYEVDTGLAAEWGHTVSVHRDGVNHGFGGGVNRAVARATDPGPILLLNPDCRITADTLATLSRLVVEGGLAIAAPRMIYPDGSFGISGGPYPTLVKELLGFTRVDELLPATVRSWVLRTWFRGSGGRGSFGDSLEPGGPLAMDWVSGFCMMISPGLFQRLGGFDERYFLYFEDVDLCRRAAAIGATVTLARNAQALHFESASTGVHGKSRSYRGGLRTYLRIHGNRLDQMVARLLVRER